MKKRNVLLTGGSGFIGRNIQEYLGTLCTLYAPSRKELNLLDEKAVRDYIQKHKIEIVIHAANPNPVKNYADRKESMFEDSIRIFLNLYQAEDLYEQMYTLGSGAEYDKSRDIVLIDEEALGRSIPYDTYGLIKYNINQIIEKSRKQCNLRVFACYGPTDHESKFITHAIRCCMAHKPITIRQNCYFDYMHVSDLARILGFFISHQPVYRAYNICTGTRRTLAEIASIVREQMQTDNDIALLNEGWNKEYTGNNCRLLNEIGDYRFVSLEEGIRIQIESEKNLFGVSQ